MRAFNAIFATLTTLLLATVIVVSAGTFLAPRHQAPEVARTEVPAPHLQLQAPPLGSPLATITPCLERPSPLASAR